MSRKMKDSGIEWIGEIPEEWSKIKTLHALEMPITDGPHETPELLDEGILFISAEAVSCGNGKIDFAHARGYISEAYYQECCKKYVPKNNDILMIKSGATTGRVAIVDTDNVFTIWSPLAVFRCNQEIYDYKFMYYFLKSDAYQKQIENKWTFGTQQNVGMRTLEQLTLCYPTLKEQRLIVDYLDKKCSELDALIAKTRDSIVEYRMLKQAVITQAVTKGVCGERPMKNSGIEWIGEIAKEYTVYRLKHLLREPLMYGANESGIFFDEKLPRYIRITDITLDGKLKDSGKLSLEEGTAQDYILEDGDVLFARSGATVGKAFIYKKEYGKSAFAGYLIKASTNDKILSDYLFYYTQSSLYEEWKKQIFIQSTIQNIGADRYSNLPIVLPDIYEQQEIVTYLNERCAAIDALIAQKEQYVAELENYKKSLIYEYVTGKKEVI